MSITPPDLTQLSQLVVVTWDGNLISKDSRDKLVTAGLVQRAHGWNWLTDLGVATLIDLKVLQS